MENAILHPLNSIRSMAFGMGNAQQSYLADQAYLESRGGLDRARFRLGPKRDEEKRPKHTLMCPFRDLARQSPGPMMDDPVDPQKPLAVDPVLATRAMISSAILSQLVVIFHIFHNLIFDHLEAKAQRPEGLSEGLWRQRLFIAHDGLCFLPIIPSLLRPPSQILHPPLPRPIGTIPVNSPLIEISGFLLSFPKVSGVWPCPSELELPFKQRFAA